MTFSSDIVERDGVRHVTLAGRLDSATSSDFEKTLGDLFPAAGCRAVMDFSALDYISSAGLRVVLMTAKRAKQSQSRLLLCALQPHVREVFEISGFLRILEVYSDQDTALSAT